MSKIELNNITGGYNLSQINDNFSKVENVLNQKVLWRDNPTEEPNHMKNDLDMNGKRVYNLPKPVLEHEAVRYKEIKNLVNASEMFPDIEQLQQDVGEVLNLQEETLKARDEAVAAAQASGVTDYADTYADLVSKITGGELTDGDVVLVFEDETNDGSSTVYRIEGGQPVLKIYQDSLRRDLLDATKGDTIKGAIVGYKDYIHVPTLPSAASRNYPVGTRFTVGNTGTVFEIRANAPINANYPVIPVGDNFAVPVENHWATNYGAKTSKGVVTGPEWTVPNGTAQGIEYDARRSTILQSSTISGSTPEIGMIVEFNYDPVSGIGSEVMRTGYLQYGHGEYFSVFYLNGIRYLIYGASPDTNTYKIVKFEPGVEDADAIATFNIPAGPGNKRPTIFAYDADHLYVSVWDKEVYVCRYDELFIGVWNPVKSFPASRINNTMMRTPDQMHRNIGDTSICLQGLVANVENGAAITWERNGATELLSIVPVMHPEFGPDTGPEPEGAAFVWNRDRLKFEVIVNIWQWGTGVVNYFNYTDSTVNKPLLSNISPFYGNYRNVTGTWVEPRTNYGTEHQYKSLAPIDVPTIYIGGFRPTNKSTNVNSLDFAITQWNWADNSATIRESGVIKYKNFDMTFDGPNDSVFREGMRLLMGGLSYFYATPQGLRFGPNGYGKTDESYGQYGFRLDGFKDKTRSGFFSAPPVPTTGTQGAAYVASSGSLDYAVASGESMQIGAWNSVTNTPTVWYSLSSNIIAPATDNVSNLGSAGQRFGTVFAGTGTINTSDEREKQQWRDQTEAEKLAAIEIKQAIRSFKFTEAVLNKGESARWHFGVGAQTVGEILRRHGLQPEEYAFWCHDIWEDSYTKVSIYDDAGNPTGEVVDGELIIAAGERYGIRYDELAMFILAAI